MRIIPEQLDAETARDLGLAILGRVRAMEEIGRRGQLQLSEEGIEKLAEILCRGDRPTLGFYRRYGARGA